MCPTENPAPGVDSTAERTYNLVYVIAPRREVRAFYSPQKKPSVRPEPVEGWHGSRIARQNRSWFDKLTTNGGTFF